LLIETEMHKGISRFSLFLIGCLAAFLAVSCGPSKEEVDLHAAAMRPPVSKPPPVDQIQAKPGLTRLQTIKNMYSHR